MQLRIRDQRPRRGGPGVPHRHRRPEHAELVRPDVPREPRLGRLLGLQQPVRIRRHDGRQVGLLCASLAWLAWVVYVLTANSAPRQVDAFFGFNDVNQNLDFPDIGPETVYSMTG